jgi:hypothetical protein
MAGNIGSWRVLENCGMRRVRTFYYPDADLMPGAEHGDFVYELTRGDWSSACSPATRTWPAKTAPGPPESPTPTCALPSCHAACL